MSDIIYNRTVHGPDPELPFLIISGLAAIVGAEHSVTLPPGTVWPGTAALPPELREWLCPVETFVAHGSEWSAWTATPRDVETTTGLVLVQRLRQYGLMADRLEALGQHVNLDRQSHYTLAALLGTNRESTSKALRVMRAGVATAAD